MIGRRGKNKQEQDDKRKTAPIDKAEPKEEFKLSKTEQETIRKIFSILVLECPE